MDNGFKENVGLILELDYGKSIKEATATEIYNAVSKAALRTLGKDWGLDSDKKKVCYLSMEFLIGRMIYNNLYNMGLWDQFVELMSENNIDISIFEEIEDAALGNGGLGRLAACFLDSGATLGIVLNGYGIRYRYCKTHTFKTAFSKFRRIDADNFAGIIDQWATTVAGVDSGICLKHVIES